MLDLWENNGVFSGPSELNQSLADVGPVPRRILRGLIVDVLDHYLVRRQGRLADRRACSTASAEDAAGRKISVTHLQKGHNNGATDLAAWGRGLDSCGQTLNLNWYRTVVRRAITG